jgi:hypothetical protein
MSLLGPISPPFALYGLSAKVAPTPAKGGTDRRPPRFPFSQLTLILLILVVIQPSPHLVVYHVRCGWQHTTPCTGRPVPCAACWSGTRVAFDVPWGHGPCGLMVAGLSSRLQPGHFHGEADLPKTLRCGCTRKRGNHVALHASSVYRHAWAVRRWRSGPPDGRDRPQGRSPARRARPPTQVGMVWAVDR